MGIDSSQSRVGKQSVEMYLVGGAVRDKLLGLPVKDRDWVVVGATVEDMLEMGFQPVPGVFPVFIHPQTGEEYALARRETKTGPGYHGFSVETGPDVTLEQDLARRDLTINAMAEDERGTIIDPFGGRKDLQRRLLRHVTPAFAEDPVRLLRIARFSARFSSLGFHVAHETHGVMKEMAAAGELAHLQGQRIWQEMARALMEAQPWRFFQVLHACGALGRLFPVLASALPDSPGDENPEEDGEPIAVLKRAVTGKASLALRFVCIMQYAVDAGHPASQLTAWLAVEKKTATLFENWLLARPLLLDLPKGNARAYRQYLQRFRHCLPQLGQLAQICMPHLAEQLSPLLEQARAAMLSVDVAELQEQGLQGRFLGEELRRRQEQAIASVLRGSGEN